MHFNKKSLYRSYFLQTDKPCGFEIVLQHLFQKPTCSKSWSRVSRQGEKREKTSNPNSFHSSLTTRRVLSSLLTP